MILSALFSSLGVVAGAAMVPYIHTHHITSSSPAKSNNGRWRRLPNTIVNWRQADVVSNLFKFSTYQVIADSNVRKNMETEFRRDFAHLMSTASALVM